MFGLELGSLEKGIGLMPLLHLFPFMLLRVGAQSDKVGASCQGDFRDAFDQRGCKPVENRLPHLQEDIRGIVELES